MLLLHATTSVRLPPPRMQTTVAALPTAECAKLFGRFAENQLYLDPEASAAFGSDLDRDYDVVFGGAPPPLPPADNLEELASSTGDGIAGGRPEDSAAFRLRRAEMRDMKRQAEEEASTQTSRATRSVRAAFEAATAQREEREAGHTREALRARAEQRRVDEARRRRDVEGRIAEAKEMAEAFIRRGREQAGARRAGAEKIEA